MNGTVTIKQIEFTILKVSEEISPVSDSFTGEFYKMFKKEITQSYPFSSKNQERRGDFPIHFMKLVLPLYQKQTEPVQKGKTQDQYFS